MTTFDRYLLSRYFYVFAVFFVAAAGLFAVVDGFTNLDGFQHATRDDGPLSMILLMGKHYVYQSSMIFDLVGPTLCVLAALCVFVLLLKYGEVHPVLAAGVPTYRLALPFVIGTVLVNAALIANQELVIPQIAGHLQGVHGEDVDDARRVDSMYDPRGIFISGKELYLAEHKITSAEFRLPAPELVADFALLKARHAYHLPARGSRPAGWRLTGVETRYADLPLTDAGRRVILPVASHDELFIVSDVTFDQLFNRTSSHHYLSTTELARRIQRPTAGASATRVQQVDFHARLTRPLLTLIGVFLVVPMIVRRERMSLVTNVARCMAWLGFVQGLAMASQFAGHAGLLTPDAAVWSPLILGGSLCAWFAPDVRT